MMDSNYLPELLANRWFLEFAIEVVSEAISEAISKLGFWFNVAAGPRIHAKPDDASILIFKGAP